MRTSRRGKYRNIKTFYDDKVFDSNLEFRRYIFLKNLENAGLIKELHRQVEFFINPDTDKVESDFDEELTEDTPTIYIADFTYIKDGEVVVEDVKSASTAKEKRFRWKKEELKKEGVFVVEVYEDVLFVLDIPPAIEYKRRVKDGFHRNKQQLQKHIKQFKKQKKWV